MTDWTERYQILEQLGKGSFSTSYPALDRVHSKTQALASLRAAFGFQDDQRLLKWSAKDVDLANIRDRAECKALILEFGTKGHGLVAVPFHSSASSSSSSSFFSSGSFR